MEESLRQWLEGDEIPTDFYELLGVQRFHPGRDELLQAIRKTSRVLLLYQNHQGPERAQQARRLQMLLGEAEQTLSEDGRWQPYEEGLLQQIRQQYAEGAGDASTWRPVNVRRWLKVVKNVHPNRLDELTAKLVPASESTAAAPTLKDVELVEVDEPATDQEYPVSSPTPLTQEPTSQPINPLAPPSVYRLAQPVEPPGNSRSTGPTQPTELPAQSSDARARPSAAPQSSPPRPPPRPLVSPGRSTAPTGPARLTSAANASIGSHPFAGPGSAPGQRRAAYPRQMPARRKRATEYGFLWIIGSAIVTALAFGAIGMAVILPGLLRSQPRADPSQTDLQEQTPDAALPPPAIIPQPVSEPHPPSTPEDFDEVLRMPVSEPHPPGALRC